MYQIIFYVNIINIVFTVIACWHFFKIAKIPNTPSLPYWLLLVAIGSRFYAYFLTFSRLKYILSLQFASWELIFGTVANLTFSAGAMVASIIIYVLLVKKNGVK